MKKYLSFFTLIAFVFRAGAQTTYLPLHAEEYHLLDRLETLEGTLTGDFHSSLKPIARKDAAEFLKKQKQEYLYMGNNNISAIDAYNIQRALSISGEWSETAEGDDGALPSRRPILKYFYQKQPDLVHVHTDDFFLVINPVLYAQGMKERNTGGLKYINTRGAEIRGRITNRVGFYTMLADNQEKALSYIEGWEQGHSAFPGADYYSRPSGTYDYLMARGYVDVGAFNDHFNVTFGFDKHFSGNGMRSLLLSDFAAPATFLRLRTQFGKLMYENLYLELTPDYQRTGDKRLPKKYAAIHQLSINATGWLNIGIFESTIFSKADRFGVEYLMPVIFYNSVARSLGAQQKTSLGLNFKAIALNHLQVYGQAYFDQVKFNKPSDWWGNQYGTQLGLQYFNAFTISNLDLQAEWNRVRPFTYASGDGISDYTHYNQPLAHPLGSGFSEWVALVRYQPLPRLHIQLKGIYTHRGTDSTGNMGNSIFNLYQTRPGDEGYKLTPGDRMTGIYADLNINYELRPNIYLETGATHLRREYASGTVLPSATVIYGGLRWNIARRQFDYY